MKSPGAYADTKLEVVDQTSWPYDLTWRSAISRRPGRGASKDEPATEEVEWLTSGSR